MVVRNTHNGVVRNIVEVCIAKMVFGDQYYMELVDLKHKIQTNLVKVEHNLVFNRKNKKKLIYNKRLKLNFSISTKKKSSERPLFRSPCFGLGT